MREVIIYLVDHQPGGEDGRDPSQKGGLQKAFWLRPDAENFAGKDTRHQIRPTVVDVDQAQRDAIKKLNPLDLLVLGITVRAGKITFIDPNVGNNVRG